MDRATEWSSIPKNVAYILLKCEPGFEEQVVNTLKKTDGVVQVDQVYGSPYDNSHEDKMRHAKGTGFHRMAN